MGEEARVDGSGAVIDLRDWVLSSADEVGKHGYAEVHIDWVVDSYVAGESLKLATDVLHRAELVAAECGVKLMPAIGQSLVDREQSPGAPPVSAAELQAEFDWSPPSLYLFPIGSRLWVEGTEIAFLSRTIVPSVVVVLITWQSSSERERRRSCWIFSDDRFEELFRPTE